jgi:hypothetical protein
MKKAKKRELVIAAAIAGISLSGCGTITNAHVHHMNNQQLVLARYQVMSRLAGPHYSSGMEATDPMQILGPVMIREDLPIRIEE